MVTARVAKNRHEIEIRIDGHPISVESAEIGYDGKRRVLLIRIADFKLLPDSNCPERNRFEAVMGAFGSDQKVAALQSSCSMLKLNSRACDGCADRPI